MKEYLLLNQPEDGTKQACSVQELLAQAYFKLGRHGHGICKSWWSKLDGQGLCLKKHLTKPRTCVLSAPYSTPEHQNSAKYIDD